MSRGRQHSPAPPINKGKQRVPLLQIRCTSGFTGAYSRHFTRKLSRFAPPRKGHRRAVVGGTLTLFFLFVGIALTGWVPSTHAAENTTATLGHPRLYFTESEQATLRALRNKDVHARIWANVAESADWCLTKTPRTDWIAPIADDPIYENLYDRFYAMMMDMAITEHLAIAYALSGDERYGDATRAWALACCRAWRPDAEATPDGGKAYAVSRLIKGIAVAYDKAYDRFTEADRAEIVAMLSDTAGNYYTDYFNTPEKMAPTFHTHHAVVEFSSLGVVALALLNEVPEAADWLTLTTKKFEEHLLPTGLAEDGSQVEGATFWASTMHYRLFFLDALRRVTGKDLYGPFKRYMQADLALASVATRKQPGWNEPNQSVLFSPPYGQLDYYAPVLLALAREYRNGTAQTLALWDQSLGHIQKTRYITPTHKEQLLFELGGYAYVWYDATVAPAPDGAPLSYHFPPVGEAYARANWKPDGLLVALKDTGDLLIHAGGNLVFQGSNRVSSDGEEDAHVALSNLGAASLLSAANPSSTPIQARLERPNRVFVRLVISSDTWSFLSHALPQAEGNTLTWDSGVTLRIEKGAFLRVEPGGFRPPHVVGMGKLFLVDPQPIQYPVIHVAPEGGVVEIEVRLPGTEVAPA